MFINVNHQDIYYEKRGEGQPIILVHGNGETHEIFNLISSQLEKSYTVYVLDSRGHGQSSPVNQYHYVDMMEDIAACMDALHLHGAYFFGFSDGGIIGLLLAIHHPELISVLMVAGPNTHPRGLRAHFYASLWLHQKLKPSPFIRLMLHEPHIAFHELNYISIPTLLLAGENDIARHSHFKRIASHIKNCTFQVLKGETHESYVVNSPKLYSLITDFLSKL